ncbi:sodium:proton antiporter [Marivirga tractuosa]|uniref:Transporter, NhaC family n=1 Tax=Marivirga tractuosa (strain ATCC 23168 / DSM 4126 / NBRC 15989 / NCIMB 1408 / VKM B-1430 / H-43) TaxID=643867 RepID=E4TUQ2_MARTH|nr:Na+/H+ antiporter NhaC [Marivirga tractuosa]ADR20030.1 transporter, NhaC family [Marivirga tractuosa DSM 4126]BDD15538.1 sodium:proton antiporter [Marivirga tractuosa]
MTDKQLKPSLIQALIPIIFLISLLSLNVYFFGDGTLDGSNQIALILSAGIAAIVALKVGFKWTTMLDGIVSSISSAMSSILILLLIGSLAGTWLLSGIVPAMIYYGLNILNPTIFLFAACIVSAIVSVATGSSWSTIATLGLALLGIGQTLGMSEGVVAGAIISGAYFGDKMSPLSDTTNLAPAMAGTDLFTHIRYMAYTTIPSIVIALIIFLVLGLMNNSETDIQQVGLVQAAIQDKFNINLWLFLVPAIVIFMIVKKISAIPALLIGSLLGGAFAIIFQPQIIETIAGGTGNFFEQSYKAVMVSMYGDISISTNNEMVNDLLSTGGMAGMLNTIWLIVCAMVFGGVMESTNMLRVITASIIKLANSTGSLVASTAGTCVFFNVTASDQYLAIVVPGRMFAETYRERGLKPEVLSRTLEDSGTVTSVLIPWNTCGATQSSVLGVSTWTYAPYAFFNIISPFMTILFAYLNIKIRRFTDK